MENNEKLEKIQKLLENSSTFSGFDIPSYTEEEFQEFAKRSPNKAETSFIKVQDENNTFYIPKNLTGSEKSGTALDTLEDMYLGAFRNYSARGIKFKDLNAEDVAFLKETFGDMVSRVKIDKNNFEAVLFTHVDKKNIVEKTVDRSFGAVGVAAGVPAAALATGCGLIFSNPYTGVLMFQYGIAAGLGAAISGAVSGVSASIPKALDFIKDKLNGDEREVALEFAKNKLAFDHQGPDVSFESQLKLNKGEILEKIKNTQESFTENKNDSSNKAKLT